VRRAQKAALARVRPGARAKDVDAVVRKLIKRAGYLRFLPHGTGHGVGLEVHELPSLAPSSRDVLQEGMVVTVEPGIYVPEIGGARIEDMVLVKSGGYEILTRTKRLSRRVSGFVR
jgi:Xaa-Pro aminopeptidase